MLSSMSRVMAQALRQQRTDWCTSSLDWVLHADLRNPALVGWNTLLQMNLLSSDGDPEPGDHDVAQQLSTVNCYSCTCRS